MEVLISEVVEIDDVFVVVLDGMFEIAEVVALMVLLLDKVLTFLLQPAEETISKAKDNIITKTF